MPEFKWIGHTIHECVGREGGVTFNPPVPMGDFGRAYIWDQKRGAFVKMPKHGKLGEIFKPGTILAVKEDA